MKQNILKSDTWVHQLPQTTLQPPDCFLARGYVFTCPCSAWEHHPDRAPVESSTVSFWLHCRLQGDLVAPQRLELGGGKSSVRESRGSCSLLMGLFLKLLGHTCNCLHSPRGVSQPIAKGLQGPCPEEARLLSVPASTHFPPQCPDPGSPLGS